MSIIVHIEDSNMYGVFTPILVYAFSEGSSTWDRNPETDTSELDFEVLTLSKENVIAQLQKLPNYEDLTDEEYNEYLTECNRIANGNYREEELYELIKNNY